MIVFCGPESEAELLDHLDGLESGDLDRCDWLHVTNTSRFDATMAPKDHSLLRAETVVRYDSEWATEAKAFGDDGIRLLSEYARFGDLVFRRQYTPLDIEARLTTMKRGSIKHGAYNTLQMGFLRPNDLCSRSETPITGLFVGGASMYPGGMILGGPGYIAAGVVEEFLGGSSVEEG